MGPRCGRGPIVVRITVFMATIPIAWVVALGSPNPATASACGDAVLRDWFDNGRIDRLYALSCYDQARASLPQDIRDYSDAEEVIGRALSAAARGVLSAGGLDPSPNGAPGGFGLAASAAAGQQSSVAVEPARAAGVPVARGSSYRPRIAFAIFVGLALVLLAVGGREWLSRTRDDSAGPGNDNRT
jgi:hypothetical protein